MSFVGRSLEIVKRVPRVRYKHELDESIYFGGLLALPSAAAMAVEVEMILIPCTPQLRPDECGVKVSVTGGTATFTTAAGEVVTVSPGTAVY